MRADIILRAKEGGGENIHSELNILQMANTFPRSFRPNLPFALLAAEEEEAEEKIAEKKEEEEPEDVLIRPGDVEKQIKRLGAVVRCTE